jgi:hypothetical protein
MEVPPPRTSTCETTQNILIKFGTRSLREKLLGKTNYGS